MVDKTPEEDTPVEEETAPSSMSAYALGNVIADYLRDRDDIATAEMSAVDHESGGAAGIIETQGGTRFQFDVYPA